MPAGGRGDAGLRSPRDSGPLPRRRRSAEAADIVLGERSAGGFDEALARFRALADEAPSAERVHGRVGLAVTLVAAGRAGLAPAEILTLGRVPDQVVSLSVTR